MILNRFASEPTVAPIVAFRLDHNTGDRRCRERPTILDFVCLQSTLIDESFRPRMSRWRRAFETATLALEIALAAVAFETSRSCSACCRFLAGVISFSTSSFVRSYVDSSNLTSAADVRLAFSRSASALR